VAVLIVAFEKGENRVENFAGKTLRLEIHRIKL
jgi:hypothetical protein